MAVVTVVVAIIVAAPQEAGPRTADAQPSSAAWAATAPFGLRHVLGDATPRQGASRSGVAGAGGGAGPEAGPGGLVEPVTRPPHKLRGYRWPISKGRITSFYGERYGGFLVVDGRRLHEGLDIASYCGAPVRAAHAGTILAAGRDFARYTGFSDVLDPFYERLRRRDEMSSLPIVVVVEDGNGYRSVYAHLESATVKRGDRVRAGEIIGKEGDTGNATGCHLHYELIRMDGPWMRVAPERVRRDRYPRWVRERVDPLLVLSLSDPKAPRQAPGVTPSDGGPRTATADGTAGGVAGGDTRAP